MIITVHDYGSIHGGLNWSNPRSDEGEPLDLVEDWDPEERSTVAEAVVDQVKAWADRPTHKSTYDFQLRETWRESR